MKSPKNSHPCQTMSHLHIKKCDHSLAQGPFKVCMFALFLQDFIAVGLKLVLVLVYIRLTKNTSTVFHNLVDLAIKLWFYELNT